MAINERLIDTKADSSGVVDEANLTLELDAGDVDSYDGTGDVWYDIHNFEFTPTTNVAENFNTVLYDGTSGVNVINTVGFQPDLVWIKVRNNSGINALTNSINGDNTFNIANTDAAIGTNSSAPKSFNSLGFTLGAGNANWNSSSYEYVAWCFKAGGAPTATNVATSGAMTDNSVSIDGVLQTSYTPLLSPTIYPEKISANNNLGFSIVSYTGNNTLNATVANGLDCPSEMIIIKTLTNAGGFDSWGVYHSDLASTGYLNLDLNVPAAYDTGYFGSLAQPSTGFRLGNYDVTNDNTDMIAYCFASKRGVSEVGAYIGTGAAGNFIFTGFEPAFLLQKSTSTGNWHIFDNKRNANNPRVTLLSPNTPLQEGNISGGVDFNRNGFTFITTNSAINGNGQNYIYYAVAANTNETGLTLDTAGFTQGTTKSPTDLNLQGAGYTGSGDWLDSSGNSNNGVITGATYVNQSSASYFSFDGSNDFVNTGSSTRKALPMSVEMWINPGSFSAPGVIYSNYDGGTVNGFYIRLETSGKFLIDCYIKPAGTFYRTFINQLGSALPLNQWSHCVFTFDASYVKAYLNGVLDAETGTNAQGIGFTSSFDTLLAKRATANYFSGGIGQVRVYNTTLSPADIQANYEATKQYILPNLELNLEAGNNSSYPGTGTTWFDLTSNNNDGTITGATWQQEVGNFFEFDSAQDDKISVASSTAIQSATSYSIESWINPTTFSGIPHLWSIFGSGNKSFCYINDTNGNVNFTVYNDSSSNALITNSTVKLELNKWNHVMCTVGNGGFLKVYINGEEAGSISQTGTQLTTGTSPFLIGALGGFAAYDFTGGIGQVRLYSSVLSLAQVRQNFNFTSSLYPNYFPGTLGAGAAKPAWDPAGYFEFDGSSDKITLPISFNNAIDQRAKSITMWVNANELASGFSMAFSYNDSASRFGRIVFQYNHSSNLLQFLIGTNSAGIGYEETTLTSNTWHHLAVSINGTSYEAYKDGVSVGTGTTDLLADASGATTIGIYSVSNQFSWNGEISKVKAYTNALTPEEINILHSEGF